MTFYEGIKINFLYHTENADLMKLYVTKLIDS
jgi:hypothetical protein